MKAIFELKGTLGKERGMQKGSWFLEWMIWTKPDVPRIIMMHVWKI
jgi:hypothetical protein